MTTHTPTGDSITMAYSADLHDAPPHPTQYSRARLFRPVRLGLRLEWDGHSWQTSSVTISGPVQTSKGADHATQTGKYNWSRSWSGGSADVPDWVRVVIEAATQRALAMQTI